MVECNSQRIKTTGEIVRETAFTIDPITAHLQIVQERNAKDAERDASGLTVIDPDDDGVRCRISRAKYPLLEAVQVVIDSNRDYWPLLDSTRIIAVTKQAEQFFKSLTLTGDN